MPQTTTQVHITDVGTVGVPVADHDRALAFYRDTLGFEVRMDAAYGEGERWVEVAPPGAGTSVALVRAHDDYRAGIDTGIRLTTTDAAADFEAFRTLGVDVQGELIPFPVPMFVFNDPDGNTLFIVERGAM